MIAADLERFIQSSPSPRSGAVYVVQWEGSGWLMKDGKFTTKEHKRAVFSSHKEAMAFLTVNEMLFNPEFEVSV